MVGFVMSMDVIGMYLCCILLVSFHILFFFFFLFALKFLIPPRFVGGGRFVMRIGMS